jgi:hypothetical protein
MRRLSCLALGITLAFSSVAFAAQADVPSNPNIQSLVRDVDTRVISLQQAVAALTPPPVGTVAVTPPFDTQGNASMICSFIPLVDGLTVRVEHVVVSGDVLPGAETRTASANRIVFVRGLVDADFVYCRFTVFGGTKDQIVANGIILQAPSGRVYAQDAR